MSKGIIIYKEKAEEKRLILDELMREYIDNRIANILLEEVEGDMIDGYAYSDYTNIENIYNRINKLVEVEEYSSKLYDSEKALYENILSEIKTILTNYTDEYTFLLSIF